MRTQAKFVVDEYDWGIPFRSIHKGNTLKTILSWPSSLQIIGLFRNFWACYPSRLCDISMRDSAINMDFFSHECCLLFSIFQTGIIFFFYYYCLTRAGNSYRLEVSFKKRTIPQVKVNLC